MLRKGHEEMEVRIYWLEQIEGRPGVFLRFNCPHCGRSQPPTKGVLGNYCCAFCMEYLQYEAPTELRRAMELANVGPECAPECAEEEELAGEDAEETIILEMPDILQTMAMAANERKGDYRSFSPSWGVFELLATMLQLTVVTATEAASIVAAERDHNVD